MNACIDLFLKTSLFFLTAGSVQAKPEKLVYHMAEGRVVQAEVILPSDPQKPTFLFMPGVNRAVLSDDPAIEAVVKKGYGAITFNFSTQPFSVVELGKEAPYFENQEVTLTDLADETRELTHWVQEKKGVKTVIPVSLSYTGAVSPRLSGFPMVIDTSPMTSADAANPQLAQYRAMLKFWELNPFAWSPAQTRAALDVSYRQHWSAQVAAMISQFGFSADRTEQMIQGYISMSRAAEEFDWKTATDFSKSHVFILAGNESSSLQSHQMGVFAEMLKKNKNAVMIVIEESGHVIPADQPEAYAMVLDLIASGNLGLTSGVVVVTPSTGKIQRLSGQQAFEYVEQHQ